jgi:membrane protein implicated in regulation of membrane protease activity
MTSRPVGLVLMAAGAILALVGLLVWSGALRWFGALPGDIRVDKPGMRFYFPIVSMLLLSVALTLLLRIVRRFF